jgi:hypothetical protein
VQEHRQLLVARISADIRALANLSEVCDWLIELHHSPVRLDAEQVPALGRQSWLRVARPITARRAVLCTLWLLEEIDARVCLLAGTLRFVAHPTASEVRLSFVGRTVPTSQGDSAARQLLELIASSIGRPRSLSAAG